MYINLTVKRVFSYTILCTDLYLIIYLKNDIVNSGKAQIYGATCTNLGTAHCHAKML